MKKSLVRALPYVVPCLILGLFVILVATAPAVAQVPIRDTDPYGLGGLRVGLFRGGFFDALANILTFALLVAGIVAFFFVLYGGFVYLTAGGDAARAATGRTVIINAIIGLIIIFLSLALIRFVITRTRAGEQGVIDSFTLLQPVEPQRIG